MPTSPQSQPSMASAPPRNPVRVLIGVQNDITHARIHFFYFFFFKYLWHNYKNQTSKNNTFFKVLICTYFYLNNDINIFFLSRKRPIFVNITALSYACRQSNVVHCTSRYSWRFMNIDKCSFCTAEADRVPRLVLFDCSISAAFWKDLENDILSNI